MRKILSVCFFLLTAFFVLSLSIATTAKAADKLPLLEEQDQVQESGINLDTNEDSAFTTIPNPEDINDSTPKIEFTFRNLNPDTEYKFCSGTKSCFLGLSNPNTAGTVNVPKIILNDKYKFSIPFKPESNASRIVGEALSNASKKSDSDGVLRFDVCGGKDRIAPCGSPLFGDLKLTPNMTQLKGGKVYTFSLGTDNGTTYTPQTIGFFYVPRAYPDPSISPTENLTAPSTLTVTLKPSTPEGNPVAKNINQPDSWIRNNYQITMVGGTGYNGGACVAWDNSTKSQSLKVTFSDLSKGRYTMYVREQVGEDDIYSMAWRRPVATAINVNGVSRTAIGYKSNRNALNGCSGGFIYWKATCEITTSSPGGKCGKFIKDPRGDEYKQFLKALNELNKVSALYRLPCGGGKFSESSNNCLKVDTAIGPINVSTPQAFIKSIFQLALVVAGFGGVVLIIISGYIMMTSAGDKEKVQGAREMLTSAIVGMLFIILSIVILEIIGVDILRLPGFSR